MGHCSNGPSVIVCSWFIVVLFGDLWKKKSEKAAVAAGLLIVVPFLQIEGFCFVVWCQ